MTRRKPRDLNNGEWRVLRAHNRLGADKARVVALSHAVGHLGRDRSLTSTARHIQTLIEKGYLAVEGRATVVTAKGMGALNAH